MKVVFVFFLSFTIAAISFGQKESTPYVMYPEKVVLNTSLSINSSPFKLQDNFGKVKQLKFKPNLNLIQGVGVSYKGFSFNISYKLPGHVRDKEKYGKTRFFDLGLQFSLKKWDFTIDFLEYKGYGIQEAKKLSPTLPTSNSGFYLNNKVKSRAFGINAYRFFNPDLKMKPAVGIVGRYTSQVHGLYLRLTTNLHGVSAKNGILPHEYLNTTSSIHKANSISAFDFGAIPGYAYVNNINGWQFGAFAGIGAVIQTKFYSFGNTNRGFLGLAPRYDLKLQFGYNVDNWFLMLTSEVDQKNIRFNDFKYNQTYYSLKINYGYRFNE